jgi:hypothetical protein
MMTTQEKVKNLTTNDVMSVNAARELVEAI